MTPPTYEQIKACAQREANYHNVEYGVRHDLASGKWEYAEAAWYAVVHNREGWSLDDIEIICPEGDEASTWPQIVEFMDGVDEDDL